MNEILEVRRRPATRRRFSLISKMDCVSPEAHERQLAENACAHDLCEAVSMPLLRAASELLHDFHSHQYVYIGRKDYLESVQLHFWNKTC